MKTTLRFTKITLLAAALSACFISATFAQSGPGGGSGHGDNNPPAELTNGLSFVNPTLKSGNDLKKGAVYLFKSVTTNVDATVTIDSLVNGAKVNKIDDNSMGYKNAFQPEVASGNVIGRSYAVFKVSFFKANTSTPETLQTVNATALDIDGNLTLKEFAEVNMGSSAKATYMGKGLLDISLLNLLLGKFRGENLLGIERSDIDTTSYGNMFTTTNTGVTSYTFKVGTFTLLPTNTARQFSMYMKGFTYPAQSTLPVELISFSAILNLNKVDIKWVTASERNVSHFVVEKSVDGKNYTQAGIVFAYGNTSEKESYSFTDNTINTANAGVTYYRLRSIDIDQKSQLSETRLIRIGKQTESVLSIATYPNPAANDLRVTIPNNWQGKKVSYEVFNNNSQAVVRTVTASGSQTETLNISSLAPGFYIVKAVCNGEMAQQKIIKQ